MKKLLCALLCCFAVCGLAACGDSDKKDYSGYTEKPFEASEDIYNQYKTLVSGKDVTKIKIGAIMVGDEEEGYTLAHYDGLKKACEELGIDFAKQVIVKWNIGESEKCLEAANELVAAKCDIIFANSFGHESYMLQAAKANPTIQFCHATGYQAASSKLANMSNYFNSVYESRFVSGIYAGYKLNEMAEADPSIVKDGKITIGYVGAYSYAEVKSGYTAFYLGVKSVCKNDVTMKVQYTGSWASQSLENDAAKALIDEGCVLISQHADTTGAASACEEAKVYDIGYNVSMIGAAPNYAVTSATLNWGSYYSYALSNMIANGKVATDWCEGYKTGAVKITEVNKKAFDKAETYNAAVKAANAAIQNMIDGKLHVFNTANFNVDGKALTSTTEIDGYYGLEYIQKDTVNNVTYFAESTLASAPSFAFVIDGIKELNTKF